MKYANEGSIVDQRGNKGLFFLIFITFPWLFFAFISRFLHFLTFRPFRQPVGRWVIRRVATFQP